MFKPVSVTVGADVTLLLPAVSPKATDVVDFEAEMALTVGALVKTTAGLIYWCTAAGNAGSIEPDHVDGDAVSGSATLRKHHARREYLALVNHGAVAVTLGLGDPAEVSKGIVLNPAGGSVEFRRGEGPVPQGKITGISGNDTSVVGIQEG